MRAVGLLEHGGPEVLQVVDVPAVNAGPGEVRIDVKAAAVNPTDTMARNGSRASVDSAARPPGSRLPPTIRTSAKSARS